MTKHLKRIVNNTMFQYTVISLIITLATSHLLITTMQNNSEKYSIEIYSRVYMDYIRAIPRNYPEIIHELLEEDIENLPVEEIEDHTHVHDERVEGTENDDLIHFITDLLVLPSIREISIVNAMHHTIYHYSENDEEIEPENEEELIDNAFKGNREYHIVSKNTNLVLHLYLPIVHNEKVIGLLKIVDQDKNITQNIQENNELIYNNIITGGLIFYLLLFFLFLRATISQALALKKLNKSQELTINAMSVLAELRDDDTGTHIIRTREYCRIIAEELRKYKKYHHYITDSYIEDLTRSAPLHDIGKVGISDSILLKPGKLTPEEFEKMKKHPEYGAEVLHRVSDKQEFKSFFTLGIEIILHHHENWDGSGYPHKLAGEEIPLSARIMAISDVYDALRTTRPYKKPFSHEEAVNIITSESGKKFDPELIEVFIKLESQFYKISSDHLH